MSALSLDRSPFRLSRPARWPLRTPVRDLCLLSAVTVATRVPVLGIAEPDSALFATGARQWLRGGPANLSIYSAHVCALYYAAVTALIRLLHLGEQECVLLMSVLSLIACLGIVSFGYLLGARLAGARAALAGMLLFALSPGAWWTTSEPHPQAVSACFCMAAIWSFFRYLEQGTLSFAAASVTCFGLAMAIKNDALLLTPALLAAVFWTLPSWRNFIRATLVAGLATGLSLLVARIALGPTAHPVQGARQAVAIFGRLPSLFDLVRDGAPVIFGIGLLTALVMTVAVLYGICRNPERRRWWAVLVCWCLPGYAFWMYISGNNVRHVMIFGIPLFWLAAQYLRMRYVIACSLLSLQIPPNSNMFMFPSPNVPGSALLVAAKKREIAAMADQLAQQNSCFIGSYTNDYVVNALLDRGGRVDSELSPTDVSSRVISMPGGVSVRFDRIDPSQKLLSPGACRSLEYQTTGRKVRFLGGEWHIPIV